MRTLDRNLRWKLTRLYAGDALAIKSSTEEARWSGSRVDVSWRAPVSSGSIWICHPHSCGQADRSISLCEAESFQGLTTKITSNCTCFPRIPFLIWIWRLSKVIKGNGFAGRQPQIWDLGFSNRQTLLRYAIGWDRRRLTATMAWVLRTAR